MNKNTENKQILSVDRFDEEISLWQLIPCGSGRGTTHLRLIADSILNNNQPLQPTKPLSLLLHGKGGAKKTHASAFLRAIGIDSANRIPAGMLYSLRDMSEYFDSAEAHIITEIDDMHPMLHMNIDSIIEKGEFTTYKYQNEKECHPVTVHVILTANDISDVSPLIVQMVNHVVRLESYTKEQLKLVLIQRLKYCGIESDISEKTLDLLIGDAEPLTLYALIRVLKVAITVMLADSRRIMTDTDIRKAVKLA